MLVIGEVLFREQSGEHRLVELCSDVPGLGWGKGVQIWVGAAEHHLAAYSPSCPAKGHISISKKRLQELGMLPRPSGLLCDILEDGSPLDSDLVARL